MPDPTPTTPPTAEQLQAEVNAAAAASGAIPTEIRTATGQVFRGNTPQELINSLQGSVESGTTHIKTLNDQNQALQAELNRLRADMNTGAQPVNTPAPATNDPKIEYYNQFTQDPIKATEYALNQIPAFQNLMKTVENVQQSDAAHEFLREVPEFPQSPQNAQLMGNALNHFGLEATAPNMVFVYNKLVHAGLLQPQNVPIAANTVQPAPMLQGSSPGPSQGGFDMGSFANLPPDKMREVINNMAARGLK